MFGKFKLLCWVCLGAWLATTSAQNTKQQNSSPRLLVIDAYYSSDPTGEYKVFRAFIVNYSDDTLRFWGSKCRPTEFFTVTHNDYMHLADEECNSSVFEQIAIPPRRSLLIPLRMLVEKQPYGIIGAKISMKFYKWFPSNHFIEDRKFHHQEILADTITLKYDKDSVSFGTTDRHEQELKEKLILPTTELHLLTTEERKLYTVTADETQITEVAKREYSYAKEKVFRIPVTIHNNGDDTLKYYSMTCSWQDFYHIDNKNLDVFRPPCEYNTPTEVTVAAHSVHTDIIAFSCKKSSSKNPRRFRLGLNIDKNVGDDPFGGYEELRRYNIVWSNEVQFIKK